MIVLALVVGVLVGVAAMKHRLSGRHGGQAGSVVLKVAPPESAAGNDMDAAWLRTIRTHAQMLQSDAVLQRMLLDQGERPPVPGASRSEKILNLRKTLSVRVVPGTALIEVRANDGDPVPHKSAAEALADAYVEWLKGQARKDYDRKIQLLRNLKDLYWNQLRELEERQRKMHADLTVKGMTGTGRFSVLESQLEVLVQRYVDAGRKAADTRDMLDNVVQQLAQNVELPQIEQGIEQDVRLRELISRLDQLDIRRDVELLTVPATDPTIARIDREREALQRKIREIRDENRARATVRFTDQLRSEADAAIEEYKKAKDALDAAKEEMAELSAELTTYLSIVADQKALRQLYQQISEQLQDLQQRALTNPPLPVEIVSRP